MILNQTRTSKPAPSPTNGTPIGSFVSAGLTGVKTDKHTHIQIDTQTTERATAVAISRMCDAMRHNTVKHLGLLHGT